jgi:hypothetical protein
MKRFCILACIAVLSISLFGGAISPQKTHAQITQANKLQLEGFAKEVIDIEKNLYEQKFFANPENAEPQIQLGARYLEILQKTYDEVSKDPTKTPAFFNFKTSTAYLNFLDAEIASNSGGPSLNVKTSTYQEVVQRVRIIANQRNLLDIASLNAEQGKITNANKIELKNAANNASAAANAAAAEKAAAEECSLISNSPIIGCLNQAVTWLIKNTLLEIAGFFTWLTANMFNFAIKLGILGFAKWAPDSLYPIWTIVRQILSLIIVFIGLYLGLMYIIGKDQLFAKFFPWVILFALFVNFSYTLTRTAIDVSNVISLKIYASVVGPGAQLETFHLLLLQTK